MVDYATSLVSVDKVQKIKKTQDIDAWLTKASPASPRALRPSDGLVCSAPKSHMYCSSTRLATLCP